MSAGPAFAMSILSQDTAGLLTDPLAPSARVDVAITERASVPVDALDTVAPSVDTADAIHVPSLVPACDTFADDAAPSCAFISWFADEATAEVSVPSENDNNDGREPTVSIPASRSGILTEPTVLIVLGIVLVGGGIVGRLRNQRRRHRRRASVGAPQMSVRPD